jgi:flavin reductase (DIM6/NTAB) family NADH-FMN oxidoreductase RutF
MREEERVFNWLPCSVVFIGTAYGEERDIMTATAVFVSEKEPIIAVSVAENHLTAKLMDQSGEFTLSIASEEQKELIVKVGKVRGESEDKFKRFGIQTVKNASGKWLIPQQSAAWMECKVLSSQGIDGYHLVLGKVVHEEDLRKPPLVWHKDAFFALKAL